MTDMQEKPKIVYAEPQEYFPRSVRKRCRFGEFDPKAFLPRLEAVMLGHAVGDALGVPVEFCSREELRAQPVLDMRGWGTYSLPKGCWSDDTSMALATLDSLSQGKLDLKDIMDKFVLWYENDHYTPTGHTFDVGTTCSYAIERYKNEGMPPESCGVTGEYANGNGALMRIHPLTLFAWYSLEEEEWERAVEQVSALTHAHPRSVLGCKIYSAVLLALLDSPQKSSIHRALREAKDRYSASPEFAHYARIFSPNFAKLSEEDIQSSGYVVHTLEAALWCLLTTTTYKACVLKAVNLGDDTDTTAAVAGGLAAALYGKASIPAPWLDLLKKKDYILSLCQKSCQNWQNL